MRQLIVILGLLAVPWAHSQQVDQSRGIDPRVDYQSLKQIGPWDDRNYALTQSDIAILADNESELKMPVPAFYRVLHRQEFPDTPTTGSVQYPRSTFNYFKMRFGGYLIDDQIYTDVTLDEQFGYEVILQNGQSFARLVTDQVRALNGEVRVNTITNAAESAVSISPANPNLVVAGMNLTGQDMFFSTDGGNNWTESPSLTGNTCCDPAMEWSSDGSFAYVVALGGNDVWFYRSDDAGQTWDSLEDETPGDDRRELAGPTGALDDKEYIHVDRSPTSPFQDNIYVTWHQSNIMQFARSTDNGNTFNIVSFPGEPRGIGSDITTDANGTIYHFWPAFSEPSIRMNISTDGGATFAASTVVDNTNGSFDFPIPSMDTRNVFMYVAADTDLTGGSFNGRMYASWTDNTGPDSGNPVNNHAIIRVGHSDDGGQNWTINSPHSLADTNDVDRWHQWLKVDPNGNVHVVFYDTRNFADRSGVDFYHSVSEDGGVTWSPVERLTSVSSPGLNDGFEFGDYNGLDIGTDGGIAIFTDNRAEGGGGNDKDVYVAPTPEVNVIDPDVVFSDGFEN